MARQVLTILVAEVDVVDVDVDVGGLLLRGVRPPGHGVRPPGRGVRMGADLPR